MSSILMAPPALRNSSFTRAMFSSCSVHTAPQGRCRVRVTGLTAMRKRQVIPCELAWVAGLCG